MAENTIPWVYECEEFGSKKATKVDCLVIEVKVVKTSVIQIAEVQLLFSVKEQADRL